MRDHRTDTLAWRDLPWRTIARVSAIIVVIAVAIMIMTASFFPLPRLDHVLYRSIEMSRSVQRLASVLLVIVAANLFRRTRPAWTLTVLTLVVCLVLDLGHHEHFLQMIIVIAGVYALVVLLICHADFRRPMRRRPGWQITGLAVIGLAALFANAVAQRLALRAELGRPDSLADGIVRTLRLLVGLDRPSSGVGWVTLWFVWVCAAALVLLAMGTALVGHAATRAERQRARALVLAHGRNPSAYLTLERDKTLFFGADVDGVIAYGVVGSIVVVNGDPICAPEDVVRLLAQFQAFCRAGSYDAVFIGATSQLLDDYARLGYHHVKCGEDARFDLAAYTLAGGPRMKLRGKINRARKEGLTVHEYRPNDGRNPGIEQAVRRISQAWLRGKKSGRLGFTVGGVNLSEPMDRRYFYASDADGQIVAFNVFLPYRDGYLVDVTRRLPEAPTGATELITHEAFTQFQAEGVAQASLGLASLAHVEDDADTDPIDARLLTFIYERGNAFFGFKDLRAAKRKYAPEWVPEYFVYSTRHITPGLAYAIVRIQNPGGIVDYLRGALAARK
ncbi:MAG: DUF2156 domain-containing protein [Propionibacteriaceae bacterium]|nr:DUF2156 domain-containing protein [Propionibacteriaceae bacterium]